MIVFSGSPVSLLARGEGTISLQVSDASGAALTHATVSAKTSDTGAGRSTVTDDSGLYSMLSLPIGNYSLTVSLAGFKSATRTGISLVVGQDAFENLTLDVGDLQQVVSVEEKPDVVSVSTQQTTGLVSEKQVKDLPLNGRS